MLPAKSSATKVMSNGTSSEEKTSGSRILPANTFVLPSCVRRASIEPSVAVTKLTPTSASIAITDSVKSVTSLNGGSLASGLVIVVTCGSPVSARISRSVAPLPLRDFESVTSALKVTMAPAGRVFGSVTEYWTAGQDAPGWRWSCPDFGVALNSVCPSFVATAVIV